jgi:hypothetical protein
MIIQCSKIYHNTESKDGKPYRTSKGKPFTLITIKSHDGKTYKFTDFNGIGANWEDGCSIDTDALGFEITEKVWNGQTQYELGKPRKLANPELEARVAKLEERMNAMAEWVKTIQNKQG